jgi:hypothetical protein
MTKIQHKVFKQLKRRNFLEGSTMALIAPFLSCVPGAQAQSNSLDMSQPRDVLYALTKLRGATDNRIIIGWLKGIRYGVLDGELQPLFGMATGTFARFNTLADGSLQVRFFEMAFYTDLNTGDLLNNFVMPYTGRSVDVEHLKSGVNQEVIHPRFEWAQNLEFPSVGKNPARSAKVVRRLGPATVSGDTVWIKQDINAGSREALTDDPYRYYNEMVTYSGSWSVVKSPEINSVSARVSFTGLSNWRPWMKMDGMPGHTASHGWGEKVATIDELPEDYKKFCKLLFPKAFADPEAVLDNG